MTTAPLYWSIRADAEADTAEVLIYDRIGGDMWAEGVTAADLVRELAGITASALSVRINSPGGSVFDGMAIYNALREHPATVTTHVDGLAASIASVVALAGDRVLMADNALFMIHNPAAYAEGGAGELRTVADLLESIAGNMTSIYAGKTGMDPADVAAAMAAESWYTASEAAAAGFVDEVTGAMQLAASFDLTEYRHPPESAAAAAHTSPHAHAAAAAATPPEGTAMPDPVSTVLPAPALTVTPRMPTLTDYILAMGRNDQPRLADYMRAIRAAAPDTQVADIPGIIPVPIVTPVVNLRDGSAPLFNALGPNAAPEGASFRIPKITQNLTEAVAASEQTDVSGTIMVTDVTVTMTFIKRAVDISYEAIQYSNPGIVGIAQSELVDAVQLGCESVIVAGVEAATGVNAGITVEDDGSNAWAAISAGVSAFYGASGAMPDVFAAAPDVWAALAGMTNQLGAPLVNGVNQSVTGQWGNLFGLPVTVSPRLTAGKAFLMSTAGVKSWASGPVNLQLSQPTTFSYQLGGGRNVGLGVADGKYITPLSIIPAVP